MQARKALVMALVVLGTSAFLLPMMVSAANWSTPFALGGGGTKPAVAIDASGNQHYVWWTSNGGIQYSKCTGQGGKGCSSPKNLPTSGASYYPSIAIDPQGRPNVVFESKVGDSAKYAVYWTRLQGSNWTSPKRITREPYSELPDIAIGPGGVIHVIYQSKQNDTGYVYYTQSNGGFEFSAAQELDAAQSDAPLAEFGKLAAQGKAPEAAEGSQLSNGLYPRIAADENDSAHVVWNAPSPYGIKYRYQSQGSFGSTLNVASGQKDQTPDVTVAPNGHVGIVWGTYDDFNDAFAEYDNGRQENRINDIDDGLAQSLWPKIAADCAGNFHFVFQGSVNNDSAWNIYHRSYDPSTNSLGARETIAKIAASEQTPAVDATNIAAIVYTNTTNGIIDASTANLNIQCTRGATETPTNTPTITETPTITNTPDPNITPTETPTPTATPTVGGAIWVPNTSKDIIYRKTWKKINNNKATDDNYSRCEKNGACEKRAAAKVLVPDGYTRVKWYTAKAKSYGITNVFINDQFAGKVDLCKGSSSLAPTFFSKTYTIPARTDGQPRSFEIGAPGKHSSCSPYNSNFIVVDGFEILP
ncbi:MAG: hypothetical protein HY741_01105 [Chloroflexi bacterium]|nr:hypothetical protein [Chloroflexota bacterium]